MLYLEGFVNSVELISVLVDIGDFNICVGVYFEIYLEVVDQ